MILNDTDSFLPNLVRVPLLIQTKFTRSILFIFLYIKVLHNEIYKIIGIYIEEKL